MQAHQIVSTPKENSTVDGILLTSEEMAELVRLAMQYAEDTKDKHIILESDDHSDYFVLQYNTRFSERYLVKVIMKLKDLYRKTRHIRGGVFLTLTIAPRNFRSMKEAYVSLRKGLNKLQTLLRKRFRKRSKRLKYLSVLETQKNGDVHLHIVYMGISWLADWEELKEFWNNKYGIGEQVFIEEIGKLWEREHAVKYTMKYIRKNYNLFHKKKAGIDRAKLNMAILWSLNARTFSISKSLASVVSLSNREINSNQISLHYHIFAIVGVTSDLRVGHYTCDQIFPILCRLIGV